MTKAPKHCAYCGKPAHKATTQIFNPHKSDAEAHASWAYDGNQIVLRRDVAGPGTWGSNKTAFLHSVTVWDGETWILRYDPFCTLKCSDRFAQAAYSAGYRIQPRSDKEVS